MGVVLGVAIAITALLMPLSAYPGLLSDLSFLALTSSPFWMPAACLSLWFYCDSIHQVPDLLGPPAARNRRRAMTALLLAVNCGLLWWDVPRRLAFLHARPSFEAAAEAPRVNTDTATRHRRFGLYHVDQRVFDPRGGLYFRTRSGPDGFYTSRMAYGFCHRPNLAGSPFGDEKYALTHVVGDWYAFQACER